MKAVAAELAFCIWEKRENLLSKSLVKSRDKLACPFNQTRPQDASLVTK